MILILIDKEEDCLDLQVTLSGDFRTICAHIDTITKDDLRRINPRAAILYGSPPERKTKGIIDALSAGEAIPIYLITDDSHFTPQSSDSGIRHIRKNDFDRLIKSLHRLKGRDEELRRRIDDIKQYILENIARPFSIEDVAGFFGLEHRIMVDEFHRVTGESLREHINVTRMELVKSLLKETAEFGNYHGTAIACGYKGLSSLSYLVKKITGKTVMELHKELRRKQ